MYEYGKDGGSSANRYFIGVVLGDDEGGEEINTEDIGINFKELKLELIIDGFHAVVVVDIHLILGVKIEESYEDEEEHEWHLKGKESYQ